MRRLLLVVSLLLAALGALAADPAPPDGALGGETSRAARGFAALSLPAANLTHEEVRAFFRGFLLFNRPWGEEPAPQQAGVGLGRLYNAPSCGSCHFRDGRGLPPEAGEPLSTLTLQLAVPSAEGWRKDARYGSQLQPKATDGVAEGQVSLQWEEIRGHYSDGSHYRLRRPLLRPHGMTHGPLSPETGLSLRLAPPMTGLGLLEALPVDAVLERHDPHDRDGDGISGRANWLRQDGVAALGRFGWKAETHALEQQVAQAAKEDMGLSSRRQREGSGPVELSDQALEALTFYSRALAVPLAEEIGTPEAQAGAALFADLGCDACHRQDLTTGPHPLAALSGQRIHPFTDLLLHDMGEGLADRGVDGRLSGHPLAREWRTAPLWGLGRAEAVAGALGLLHDGRARSIAEAILWHGGEAQAAKEAFTRLNQAERQALLAFLGAL